MSLNETIAWYNNTVIAYLASDFTGKFKSISHSHIKQYFMNNEKGKLIKWNKINTTVAKSLLSFLVKIF